MEGKWEHDWRTTMMLQANPSNLGKIEPNISHLTDILKPGDSLVDVGCGDGYLYDYLTRIGFRNNYTGIDRDRESIERARERNKEVDYRIGELKDLQGSWDVVFSSRVLIHIPDLEENIRILRSCARKYCVLVLALGDDKTEWLEKSNCYFRFVSRETLKAFGDYEVKSHSPYCTVIYAS